MRALPPFLAPRWLAFLLALCGGCDAGDRAILFYSVIGVDVGLIVAFVIVATEGLWMPIRRDGEGGQ